MISLAYMTEILNSYDSAENVLHAERETGSVLKRIAERHRLSTPDRIREKVGDGERLGPGGFDTRFVEDIRERPAPDTLSWN